MLAKNKFYAGIRQHANAKIKKDELLQRKQFGSLSQLLNYSGKRYGDIHFSQYLILTLKKIEALSGARRNVCWRTFTKTHYSLNR